MLEVVSIIRMTIIAITQAKRYMPCIPSARVITNLYPEGIASNTINRTAN